MNKDEKERRGVLLRDLKAKERAEFEASLLASKADIRDLLEFLATDTPCDDTPRQTLCNTKSFHLTARPQHNAGSTSEG